MNTKHTPGPWRYRGERDGLLIIEDSETIPVCTAYKVHGKDRMANARLIAAAPDLLEALEAILDWSKAPGRVADPAIPAAYARAAIAKAIDHAQ